MNAPAPSFADEQPRRKPKTGLVALSVIPLAAAVGLQVWSEVRFRDKCLVDIDPDDDTVDVDAVIGDCMWGSVGNAYMRAGAVVMLGTTVAVSSVTSARAAKVAAANDVDLGRRPRNHKNLKIAGGVLTGASLAVLIGANAGLTWKSANCDTIDCKTGPRVGRFIASDIGTIGLSAGAGMLVYAIAYKRRHKALARFGLTPQIGRAHSGLALTGRF